MQLGKIMKKEIKNQHDIHLWKSHSVHKLTRCVLNYKKQVFNLEINLFPWILK